MMTSIVIDLQGIACEGQADRQTDRQTHSQTDRLRVVYVKICQHKSLSSMTGHRPDGVLGVVFVLDQLVAGEADGLDTVPVGFHLSLKVLVLLQLGLQVGGVLSKGRLLTD